MQITTHLLLPWNATSARLAFVLGILVCCPIAVLAGPIRTITFTASDFRTKQDNPNDYRSIGDPFGVFNLSQPDFITGYVTFDSAAMPLLGPTRQNPSDPLFESVDIYLPYIDFALQLGSGVRVTALVRSFGDAMLVRDGVGTDAFDDLWLQNTTNQILPGGVEIEGMQIQLVGPPSLLNGLAVPQADVYTAMAASMPSYVEKLQLDLYDANGYRHSLRAFQISFSEAQSVPEPNLAIVFLVAFATAMLSRFVAFRYSRNGNA